MSDDQVKSTVASFCIVSLISVLFPASRVTLMVSVLGASLIG